MTAPKHPVDVREWLKRAVDDLGWARHSYQGGFLPQACFACQQAAEKALKALLLVNDQPLRRTHSLPALLQLCLRFSAGLERFSDSVSVLDVYYAPTRYADVMDEMDYTETRTEDAIHRTEEMVGFLRGEIETRLEGM